MPKTLMWILLTTLLGCLGLPFLYSLQENSWHKVYPLPGKAAAIFANDMDTVYIRTEGGETYSCTFLTQPITCAKLLLEWVDIETLSRPGCKWFHPTPLPTPDRVIASDEVCQEHTYYASFRKYVVRNDGSVWHWGTGVDLAGDFRGLVTIFRMATGAAVGLLAGGVIVLAAKVYRQVKSQRSKR